MTILVTGTAGFIGFHVAKALAIQGHQVVGIDNLNGYYNVQLKLARLKASGIATEIIAYNKLLVSTTHPNYHFLQLDITDNIAIQALFKRYKFEVVCHLAAQAGVRYSLENPRVYVNSNVLGFVNILEACRQGQVQHLVYASSSSIYGQNTDVPFTINHNTNRPISLYAATKKSNELMAYTYSHIYKLKTTGLRFFTVYGPWGRPDMAYMLFANAIIKQQPIKIFNKGKMWRDFTFIADIVQGINKVITQQSNHSPDNLYKLYNIGNSSPVNLLRFIEILENALGITAIKHFLPLQDGDVTTTWADVSTLIQDFGYAPTTSLEEGLQLFVDWYKKVYLPTFI